MTELSGWRFRRAEWRELPHGYTGIHMTRPRLLLSLAVAIAVPCAVAQSKPQAQPEPAPMPPPIAAPVDKPYVGPISLLVDLSNNTDRVEHVHEEIPVEPHAKELVLLYPEWIPGDHAPSGPLQALGGIVTSVDGQRVQWVRDRVNVYAFHVPVAAGRKDRNSGLRLPFAGQGELG